MGQSQAKNVPIAPSVSGGEMRARVGTIDGVGEADYPKEPARRDEHTVDAWLKGRREDDGIPGHLWRIGDELYDLKDWGALHPGGADWLVWTKGMDITELFEIHHPNIRFGLPPLPPPFSFLLLFSLSSYLLSSRLFFSSSDRWAFHCTGLVAAKHVLFYLGSSFPPSFLYAFLPSFIFCPLCLLSIRLFLFFFLACLPSYLDIRPFFLPSFVGTHPSFFDIHPSFFQGTMWKIRLRNR